MKLNAIKTTTKRNQDFLLVGIMWRRMERGEMKGEGEVEGEK